jgi:hypothetical protein
MADWKKFWRPLVALAAMALLGWFAFVRHTRVPLLAHVDLGFHELGHLIGYLIPISERLTAALGSITQVAVPAGLAVYFGWLRRDRVAMALMLGWAGTSGANVGAYIADAPYERLPLIGGDHDWAFLLGPTEFNALHRADDLAGLVTFLGGVALVAGMGVLLTMPLAEVAHRRRDRLRRRRAAGGPVREVRWRGDQGRLGQ